MNDDTDDTKKSQNKKKVDKFCERDLHPLIVAGLKNHPHFKAHAKTIYHEKTKNKGKKKGSNKWINPDVVAVHFPFKKYGDATIKLQKTLKTNSTKLFSFELKIEITSHSIRENFFQALSNSNWAHEGYLVGYMIDKDNKELMEEMRSLNSAYGIGIIKLQEKIITGTKYELNILFAAKEKNDLDWNAINKLQKINPNFKDFIDYVNEDEEVGKVKSAYDEILNEDELIKYCKQKGIHTSIDKDTDDIPRSEPSIYKNTIPTSFTFLNKTYKIKKWNELLPKILEVLMGKHSDFEKIYQLKTKKRPYFSTNGTHKTKGGILHIPKKINGTDKYVETCFSANDSVKMCYKVLKEFGYSEKDITIRKH